MVCFYASVVTLKRWIVTAVLAVLAVPAWLFIGSPFVLAVRENAVPDLDNLSLPTGTTIVACDYYVVCFRFRYTRSNSTHAHFRHQFHRNRR